MPTTTSDLPVDHIKLQVMDLHASVNLAQGLKGEQNRNMQASRERVWWLTNRSLPIGAWSMFPSCTASLHPQAALSA